MDLLDSNVTDGAWYELRGTHYWLNIQAVFPIEFQPEFETHEGWGWKITGEPTECGSAVFDTNLFVWRPDIMPAPHPYEGLEYDLAFELTTDEVDTNAVIVITNVWLETAARHRVHSVGSSGAGKQYLQLSTNLLEPAWTVVDTNIAPRLPPEANVWPRTMSVSNEFYRVLERK